MDNRKRINGLLLLIISMTCAGCECNNAGLTAQNPSAFKETSVFAKILDGPPDKLVFEVTYYNGQSLPIWVLDHSFGDEGATQIFHAFIADEPFAPKTMVIYQGLCQLRDVSALVDSEGMTPPLKLAKILPGQTYQKEYAVPMSRLKNFLGNFSEELGWEKTPKKTLFVDNILFATTAEYFGPLTPSLFVKGSNNHQYYFMMKSEGVHYPDSNYKCGPMDSILLLSNPLKLENPISIRHGVHAPKSILK